MYKSQPPAKQKEMLSSRIGMGYGGYGGFEPFCTLTNFELVSVQDANLGLLPKSLLYLENQDIIVGTFSANRGYTFKAFSSSPFTRLNKKRQMTYNSFQQYHQNLFSNHSEKKQGRQNFEDMGGFFPYYEAMHFQSHFYKFHELDENSFYRFDSKQFYIIKKHSLEGQETALGD